MEAPQPRLHPGGQLRPGRLLGRGRALDVQEDVPAAQVAARLAGLRLRGLDRPGGERLEHVLDDVLGRQALDQLGLLQPDRRLVRHGAQQLRVLLAEGAPAEAAAEQAELLVARGERRGEQPLAVGGVAVHASPRRTMSSSSAARPGRGVAPARLGWVGRGQHELVGLGVEPPDLAGVGAEQLARAARDGVVQVLAQRHGGERLAQPRERGEGVDAPARLLVELGVLDRAGRERGGVHEELEDVVVELARRLGVQDHHTDHGAGAVEQGHGDHRLEALLLELRHVLHARVLHRPLADELGRARARDPAGQSLVDAPLELAHEVRVGRRGGLEHEPLTLQEVDEGGVAAGGVGGDLDDPGEHALQGQRGRDGLDDRVQRLVLAAHAVEDVAASGDR